MKLKIVALLILSLLLSGLLSCSKKGRTASTPNEPPRPVGSGAENNGPAFVTDRTGAVPLREWSEVLLTPPAGYVTEEAPKEALPDITFALRETEHVRMAYYDPFETEDRMTICLDDLARHFCYPYPGNLISDYGMRGRSMHTGIDVKAIPNDTIRAAFGGVVRMAKAYSAYGNVIVIRHACGLETVYSHNSKNLVAPNDIVLAGDPIALAGRTGRATTEHLHFEVRIKGEHFDPKLLLDTKNRRLQSGDLCLKRDNNGRIVASRSSETPMQNNDEKPVIMGESSQPNPPYLPGTPGKQGGTTSPIYEVQRGDTLYSISRKFDTTVEALCALNGIRPESTLSIGQKLKVR